MCWELLWHSRSVAAEYRRNSVAYLRTPLFDIVDSVRCGVFVRSSDERGPFDVLIRKEPAAAWCREVLVLGKTIALSVHWATQIEGGRDGEHGNEPANERCGCARV